MRQKRTFVTLLLVIAILCLGVAYAAVTQQTLTIGGAAGASSDDVKVNVAFTKADVESKPEYLGEQDVTAEVTGDITASINVSNFKSKGDTATFKYTITNKQTDMAATLENAVVTLTGQGKENGVASGWFEVTASELQGVSLTANNAEGNLETAQTVLTVTVRLKETPVTEQQVSSANDTITITINANPVPTTVTGS